MDFVAVLAALVVLGLATVSVRYFKHFCAAMTILTGDKEGLQEFGNLCEDEEPFWVQREYSDSGKFWTYDEYVKSHEQKNRPDSV